MGSETRESSILKEKTIGGLTKMRNVVSTAQGESKTKKRSKKVGVRGDKVSQ